MKKAELSKVIVVFLLVAFTLIFIPSATASNSPEEKINETEILEQLRSIFKPSDTNIRALSTEQETQYQTKDATLLLRKIYRDWDKLSAETQQEINFILIRPNLPLTHSTQHFIIHYTDVGNHSSNLFYIADIANYLENAWSTEVYSFDFDQPADTIIDVYVYEMDEKVGGFTQFFLGSISIDLNIKKHIKTDNTLKVVTAHEFFHAIQTAYDFYWEEDWILEGTAVWMEDVVYDYANEYFTFTQIKLNEPEIPITRPSTGPTDPHPYSAVLFWKYLSENYGTNGAGGRCYQNCGDSDCGVDIIKGLMEKTKTANGIQAVSNLIDEWYPGTTWYNLFWDFWITNYMKDFGNPYGSGWYDYCEDSDPFGYPNVHVRYTDTLNLGETYTTPSPSSMDYWAANYIVVYPSSQTGNIRISFNGQNSGFLSPHDFGLSLVFIQKNNGDVTSVVYKPIVYLNSTNDATLNQVNNGYDEVVIIVTGLFHGGQYELSVTGENICQDGDNDGYDKNEPSCTTGTDCNDSNPNTHPGVLESCNGKDDDCNGQIDDIDQDGDGYRPISCGGSDCNDGNPNVNPGQPEDCNNGIDDDCDQTVDGGDPDCAACSCGQWQDQGCGQSPCAPGQMRQARTCSPSSCDAEVRCISHGDCGTCDSSYTSCQSAHVMQIPEGKTAYVRSHLCGEEQYFRVTTTGTCDILWKIKAMGSGHYEFYTKWDSSCPSTGSYNCYNWTTGSRTEASCTAQDLPPGIYYAMAKRYSGSGHYTAYVQVDCPLPCEPQPETCDGMDNNCNGQVDENLYQSCGSGACQGTRQCTNGVWDSCSTSGNDAGVCAKCDSNGNPAYDGIQDGDCSPTLCPSNGCGLGGCGLHVFADFPYSVQNECSALYTCTNNACSATCETDQDGDSYSLSCGDCNDTGNTTYSGAVEICWDNLDNNCNGVIDDGCGYVLNGYVLDSYGNPLENVLVELEDELDRAGPEGTTNAMGYFEFSDLPKGFYEIEINEEEVLDCKLRNEVDCHGITNEVDCENSYYQYCSGPDFEYCGLPEGECRYFLCFWGDVGEGHEACYSSCDGCSFGVNQSVLENYTSIVFEDENIINLTEDLEINATLLKIDAKLEQDTYTYQNGDVIRANVTVTNNEGFDLMNWVAAFQVGFKNETYWEELYLNLTPTDLLSGETESHIFAYQIPENNTYGELYLFGGAGKVEWDMGSSQGNLTALIFKIDEENVFIEDTCVLSGYVLDSYGNPLADVPVKLDNAAELKNQTGSQGRFEFINVSNGIYEVYINENDSLRIENYTAVVLEDEDAVNLTEDMEINITLLRMDANLRLNASNFRNGDTIRANVTVTNHDAFGLTDWVFALLVGFKNETDDEELYLNSTPVNMSAGETKYNIVTLQIPYNNTYSEVYVLGGAGKADWVVESSQGSLSGLIYQGDIREIHIALTLPGDANGDCVVNIFDLASVGLAYGSRSGDTNWNPGADVTGDGIVNIFDLATVGLNYGDTC